MAHSFVRNSRVTNKRNGKSGEVVLVDGRNVYVLWFGTKPRALVGEPGPAVVVYPYAPETLKKARGWPKGSVRYMGSRKVANEVSTAP